MNLQVTARHFTLSEQLEELINKEVASLEKHFDQIKEVNVVLTHNQSLHHVDVTIRVNSHTLTSEEESPERFVFLIPSVMKKASIQLQRHKEKIKKL